MGCVSVFLIMLGWVYFAFNIGYRMGENSSVLVNQAEQAKLECESTLPRNEHCEVIIKAVPSKGE